MKFMQILLLITTIYCVSGCYAGITGKVIDATTQQPIEDAIVLVEWTKSHGYGFTYTKTYKVFEGFTDKNGNISIPGEYSPFVNPPHVTVYKQGYVAWNDQFIFPPGFTKRTDFAWEDGYVFRLERFKPEYTYREHLGFIDKSIGTGLIEQKIQIKKAIQFEENEAIKEVKEMIKAIEKQKAK